MDQREGSRLSVPGRAALLFAWRDYMPTFTDASLIAAGSGALLPLSAVGWWLGSVAVFGVAVAVFDGLVYGGPLTTGYRPGEISFGLGAWSFHSMTTTEIGATIKGCPGPQAGANPGPVRTGCPAGAKTAPGGP